MIDDFSRTLSYLRLEKKISQRRAAEALGVSQALLSHYENGVREPGLSFVVRAADFYGVSADYLLGRTPVRDGAAAFVPPLLPAAKPDSPPESLLFGKKAVLNSTALLYELLAKWENGSVVRDTTQYLSASLYKLFRLLSLRGKNDPQAFPVPENAFSELCDAKIKSCESRLRIGGPDAENAPDLSLSSLQNEYPELSPSLFSVLHTVSEELEKDIRRP